MAASWSSNAWKAGLPTEAVSKIDALEEDRSKLEKENKDKQLQVCFMNLRCKQGGRRTNIMCVGQWIVRQPCGCPSKAGRAA